MKLKIKCSIAIIPSQEVCILVDNVKKELFKKIGWFNSVNSKAHITISEFESTEDEAMIIINKVKTIAEMIEPIQVSFENYNSFLNGAFYISPEEISKHRLKKIMKCFHIATKSISKVYKNSEPHITIGRKLEEKKLKIALENFTSIEFSFNCEAVSIRIYDRKIQQYITTETFSFDNNPKNTIQTSLF
ncbi:MAG: 2'-5' RNA ligase family protein [Bacteroidota bacterium]